MHFQLIDPDVIPPITDPLGSSWKQPSPSLITIQGKFAKMSEETMRELPEHSYSYPTGVYAGKMWRRKFLDDNNTLIGWILMWYGEVVEGSCNVYQKHIDTTVGEEISTLDRQALAELCHLQWSGWMEYLFLKCQLNPDGTVTMPKWAVERWRRQASTAYINLSDEEKESDLKKADRFIKLLEEK